METAAVPMAGEADLQRIAAFNRTDAPFPDHATLPQLLEAVVAEHPDRTAVVCAHDQTFGMASLTFAALDDRVDSVARRLREWGVGPGTIVALMVQRSFAMAIGTLAIIKAGGAYLPLPPDNPPERNDYMLRNAGVGILLVHGATAGKTAFGGTIMNLDDPALYQRAGPRVALPQLNSPADLAYVIYTSGSTGRPKGVMIEHRPVINRLHWMQRAYPIGADDVILQKTPYYFDVSVWELFWWALEGAQVCFLQPGAERNPFAIVDTIRRHRVSVLHFVPSMLSVFLEHLEAKSGASKLGLSSVRRVFTSGEALAPEHVRRFNRCWGAETGARLTNLYGPTEATIDVSYFDCPTDDEFRIIPIGRPIDNTRFHILRDGKQVAVGEVGELCIAGVGLARGYLNNEALTAERFIASPLDPAERIYLTGDVARWLPDGNVEYLGREDHQVKIRGLRIELGEIENTMREYAGVVDCVAVIRKYSESVILIIAYLVARDGLDLQELKRFLKGRLPDYMVPNHFERIAEMPLTPSGKADRKALPEPVLQTRPG